MMRLAARGGTGFRRALRRWGTTAAIGLCVYGAPLSAQEGGASAVCFRPAPIEECRSFPLFEARGQTPFHEPYRTISSFERTPDGPGELQATSLEKELSHSFGWEAGWAVNVDERWALGATVGYEFAEASRRRSAAARFRYWAHEDIALEFAPGVFRLEERGFRADPDRTGFNAALRVALWDIGLIALRYDHLPLDGSTRTTDQSIVIDPGGTERQWSVGLGLESVTGLAGSVVGIAALGVALAVALGGLT